MPADEVLLRGAPQHVAAELIRLRDAAGGELTLAEVVTAAASPESPLHDQFEWDNDAAGDRYRLLQAGVLMGKVRLHIVEGERVHVVPQFVSVVNSDGRRVRVSAQRAIADPDMLGQVLAETRAQIRGLRNRLSGFEDAEHVVAQLDGVLGSLPK